MILLKFGKNLGRWRERVAVVDVVVAAANFVAVAAVVAAIATAIAFLVKA